MEKHSTKKLKRKKRTQLDYTMGFKLAVISQVEKGDMTYKQAQLVYGIQGRSTVLVWLRKHGNLEWHNPKSCFMSTAKQKETPAQRIKRLEKLLEDEKLKNTILNDMIDIIDNQYGAGLRKKYLSNQSKKDSKTTFSKHWLRKHPNLFKDLILTRPEQAFVSDR